MYNSNYISYQIPKNVRTFQKMYKKQIQICFINKLHVFLSVCPKVVLQQYSDAVIIKNILFICSENSPSHLGFSFEIRIFIVLNMLLIKSLIYLISVKPICEKMFVSLSMY